MSMNKRFLLVISAIAFLLLPSLAEAQQGSAYTPPGGAVIGSSLGTNAPGTVSAPAFTLNGDSSAGWIHNATSQMTFVVGGTNYLSLGGTFVRMGSGVILCWASGDSTTGCASKITIPSAGVFDFGNASGATAGQDQMASLVLTGLYSAAGTVIPTCNTAAKGTMTSVLDATTPSWHGTYTSGGAVFSKVSCNGTNWITD